MELHVWQTRDCLAAKVAVCNICQRLNFRQWQFINTLYLFLILNYNYFNHPHSFTLTSITALGEIIWIPKSFQSNSTTSQNGLKQIKVPRKQCFAPFPLPPHLICLKRIWRFGPEILKRPIEWHYKFVFLSISAQVWYYRPFSPLPLHLQLNAL